MDADRRRDVGLFRYSMVRDLAAMSPRQRGLAIRELAAREHLTPWGERVRVSRVTLDRWVRAWREGGFEALVPAAREGVPRTDQGLLELAVALKREAPERTAAQIVRIIREREGHGPAERTIQRHFVRVGLNIRPSGQAVALGRFEAERPNELWIGDALHGPLVGTCKAILFCFIDDHSRLLPGYRWGTREDVLRLEGAHRRRLDYHGPVLALWGDRDRLVPLAHRDGVMTAFPQAQLSVWKKMGHHPQRERPSELAQFIEAACGHALPGAHSAATSGKPRRGRVRAARFMPQPLAAGAGELPDVA